MIWTSRQRVGLAIIGLLIAALLGYRLLTNPATISDPAPLDGDRAAELRGRVDPNTADEATLAALPQIGPVVAERIVAYRRQWQREGRRGRAFQCIDDLKNVKGIGEVTARQLEPSLEFPVDRPATRPAVELP